ncbi:hypothetical protein SH449x_002870 [Pirellulaceae bacterium SH449]
MSGTVEQIGFSTRQSPSLRPGAVTVTLLRRSSWFAAELESTTLAIPSGKANCGDQIWKQLADAGLRNSNRGRIKGRWVKKLQLRRNRLVRQDLRRFGQSL